MSKRVERGMNFRMKLSYSVFLMSRRTNAPYRDRVYEDGITIEYEAHDAPAALMITIRKMKTSPDRLPNGKLTQNGLFIRAIEKYKTGESPLEIVKVYEKILPAVWSLKRYFDLKDYNIVHDGKRKIFQYILRAVGSLSDVNISNLEIISPTHTRLIPSEIKKEVWKRDQ